MNVQGIHHITAIAGDPQRNYDFYTGILGLRLVKRTINYDDPETYHFYYGDGLGTPGTLLTFFPWPNAQKGRGGLHQVNLISLAIPTQALGYWTHRLMEKYIKFSGPSDRLGSKVLSFQDPDGIALELVTTDTPPATVQPWKDAPVPVEFAIHGIYSTQLWVLDSKPTIKLLTKLGYEQVKTEGNITRLVPQTGNGMIEVRETGQFLGGQGGPGTIHHLAFRIPDDTAQEKLRQLLSEETIQATEVQDRKYFRSIYFREPGGVLFEIATDGPGFAIDEPLEHLGETLKLPAYLEPHRSYIEHALPDLEMNHTVASYEKKF